MKKDSDTSKRKRHAAEATKRSPRSTDSAKSDDDGGVLSEAELEKISAGKDVKAGTIGSDWDQR